MALISPTEGKKYERNPEEGNIPTGLYLCELTEVRETGPSAKFPNGNPRLIFEFTVCDGPCKGKKTVAFIGKTLHKSKEGKESALVKWARMMGIANPEQGFDPDTLVGKRFNVMVEFTPGTNGEAGRGWARQAMAATQPAVTSFPNSPTISAGEKQPSATDPQARWDYSDGGTVERDKTSAEVQDFLDQSKAPLSKIYVKPAGAPREAAKTADHWGFRDGNVIPW